jgi:hypothetical protein
MRFAPEPDGMGWRLSIAQDGGAPLTVTAQELKETDRGVMAMLTVRRGDALAYRDRVNLTLAIARRRVRAALTTKQIALDERALLALEEAFRTARETHLSSDGADGHAAIEDTIISAFAGASSQGGQKASIAAQLVALAEDVECWHTPDGDAYVTVPIETHRETYPARSRAFRTLLEHRYYTATGRAAGNEPVAAALGVLEGRGRFDGSEHTVAVRLAEFDGIIYLDLADPEWRVIEVTSTGWRRCERCPVYFRRPRGLRALPMPVAGGSVDELREWVNVASDTDWQLCVAWLLAAYRPTGPYPVLALHGEHGAAKSTTARILRSFVDPNKADLRAQPRDNRDLVIAATNGWVIALDNLSRVEPVLSDALCRLATGGGIGTRELYTDQDEVLLNVQRPVLMTGIEELATSDDLADRTIPLRLPEIDDGHRYTEAALWAAIEALRPRVLGALLTAVATGLARVATVTLDRKPRMADFAVWVTACSPALGWPASTFLDAYDSRRRDAAEVVLEASVVGTAVRALMSQRSTPWEGTAADLLDGLAAFVVDDVRKDRRRWPQSPRGLRGKLERLAPDLRRLGTKVEFFRDAGGNRIRKIRIETVPTVPTVPSGENSSAFPGRSRDGRDDPRAQPSLNRPAESAYSSRSRDGRDDRDGCGADLSESPDGDVEVSR